MLKGLKILVTAGPTYEPLDPVRYIANHSSGKQGFAIAEALRDAGAEVILVHGPVHIPVPEGVLAIAVITAQDMLEVCLNHLPVDIAICTAAVCDWRPKDVHDQKIKKQASSDYRTLELVANPDILATIGLHSTLRPKVVVGFAAETSDIIVHARNKCLNKGCDFVIANVVSPSHYPFGKDHNQVYCVTQQDETIWPMLEKREVAQQIVRKIEQLIYSG